MTEEPDVQTPITRLRQELEGAFRNRADLYRLIYQSLSDRIGPQLAESVLIEAIERRGQEVAAQAFAQFGPDDARAIGEAFLAASPDGGRMYPTKVDRHETGISFCVQRCPLKDAWQEAGIEGDDLARMCRIAGAFDRGLFEATGIRFANNTWFPGEGSRCCIIELKNAST
ncbi:L-2-amino-thiazoline-4-carboxylic acid hydrolase [Escherichia coli]|nr:hypothetical protein [Salmonella enterica subsp. enterica]EBV3599577.1 hypothetical protein [Salmonella enterica subsp. enterica serovar Virchow]EBW9044138.1 hypothetical protein [Salmonella enterica subsp. enterica serovar Enteritidis]EBY6940087.1 hypothetical protein [Salmonella enterica subsp. enterica serovar Newport]ECI7685666.1 hypothetical protein [Salmonella enterica subsp. enterica serovar Paratyphi A]EFF2235317.1 hypothetical protein [Escherichia coli]